MTYLHLISFAYPFPPSYGGVIDVYFKIKSLSEQGVKIILHTYTYNQEPNSEFESMCEKVYHYKRKPMWQSIFSSTPLIVHSRRNDELLNNLLKDDYPILFEGMHTTYFLNHPSLKSRKKIYRSHNIEHEYYDGLKNASTDFFKNLYYGTEAKRLKSYFSNLENADYLLPISLKEESYFKDYFPNKKIELIFAYHAFDKINENILDGEFVLYHGNLGVSENDQAAQFLVENVFSKLSYTVIIAGMNPSEKLKELCKQNKISLIQNSDSKDIDNLIMKSKVNVLYTEQATGIKLKLLHVLYRGKHFVVNDKMLEGTGLENVYPAHKSADEMIEAIQLLFEKEFTNDDIELRKKAVNDFSNLNKTKKILEILHSN